MEKSEILIAVGKNVRHYRQLKGLSQEDLADLTGLHRTYIGDIERGERNFGITNLVRIAIALAIPPSLLIANITTCENEGKV